MGPHSLSTRLLASVSILLVLFFGITIAALDFAFRRVTEQRPGYIPAWRYLVHLTWALGNLAEAKELAVRALHHAPDDTELASMLARSVQDGTEPA